MASTRKGKHYLNAVFGSFILVVLFVVIYIAGTDNSSYVPKTLFFQPKTNPNTNQNNLKTYIHNRLVEVRNSNRSRLRDEKKYLKQLLNDRLKIIKMLPGVTKQPFHTSFHVLVDYTQKEIRHKYDMLVLVSSYSLNFERRRRIRRFWGNHVNSLNKNWKVVFVCGGVLDKKGMRNLYKEAREKRDVLIEDFMESYDFNMGKKVMTGLQWAQANFDFGYILKCDDDIFADIDSIIATLRRMDKKYVYLGNVMRGSPVLREGRYGVSYDDYAGTVYEPYCSGGAFVLSKDLILRMVPLFQWEHPLRIDDAYMGGRVIRAGGEATNNDKFFMFNDACQYKKGLLATHPAKTEKCMMRLENEIMKMKGDYI